MCNSKTSALSAGKFTRVRFTYNDDLAFLKEFIAHNPMQNRNSWERIQQNLELITAKKFSIRTLKHHLQLLIEIWLKKDELDKIRSGIEEPLSEKDMLLQEINTLCLEYNYFEEKRKRPISREQQISELGKKARNKYTNIFIDQAKDESKSQTNLEVINSVQSEEHNYYVQSEQFTLGEEIEVESVDAEMSHNTINTSSTTISTPALATTPGPDTPCIMKKCGSSILGPARKRLKRDPIRKNALSFLKDKNEREIELKKKELELEDRKLSIEEHRLALEEKKIEMERKRLEIECHERLQRLELEKTRAQIEIEEKNITAQLLKSQQKLIDTILHNNNK